MFQIGWIADYPDPENFLDLLFHGDSKNNHTGFNNAEVNELLERARVEQREDVRYDLYRQAEELILEQAPWIPFVVQRRAIRTDKALRTRLYTGAADYSQAPVRVSDRGVGG